MGTSFPEFYQEQRSAIADRFWKYLKEPDGFRGAGDVEVGPDDEGGALRFGFGEKDIEGNPDVHDGAYEFVLVGQLDEPSLEAVLPRRKIVPGEQEDPMGIDGEPHLTGPVGPDRESDPVLDPAYRVAVLIRKDHPAEDVFKGGRDLPPLEE